VSCSSPGLMIVVSVVLSVILALLTRR